MTDRRFLDARDIVSKLTAGELSARCVPGPADDAVDQLLRGLNVLAQSLSAAAAREQRLHEIQDFLRTMAGGQRPLPLRTSGRDEVVDAVVLGLNRLAEEREGALTMQRRLRSQALYDPLTKLPNRTLLNDGLEMHLARARRDTSHVAVLFLDVDRFKPINDEFGHPAGDVVLAEVGARLRRIVRASDTVARYGGDEFVVAAAVREPEGARTIRDQAAEALEPPFRGPSRDLHVSASIGIALFPDQAAERAELIRVADAAMYDEKRRRRELDR